VIKFKKWKIRRHFNARFITVHNAIFPFLSGLLSHLKETKIPELALISIKKWQIIGVSLSILKTV